VPEEVPGAGVVLPGGANVYFLDLPPNYVSPMVSPGLVAVPRANLDLLCG
jgi:hypothetical protein